MSPGERIVRAGGVDICLEAFGDPADPAVVLIHGTGNSMLSWHEELCERLAAGARFVVRYDLRDAGRSVTYEPGAPEYGLRDLVADCVGLLDAVGVGAGHLVGMSTGGSICQLVALDHPDRAASITLASTTAGLPGSEQADLPGVSPELVASFGDQPPEPDWTDRAAVVHYLVEAQRPYAGRAFDEAGMREVAGRVFDRATNIRSSVTNPFQAEGAIHGGRGSGRSPRRRSSSTGPRIRCSRTSTRSRSRGRSRARGCCRSRGWATSTSRASRGTSWCPRYCGTRPLPRDAPPASDSGPPGSHRRARARPGSPSRG